MKSIETVYKGYRFRSRLEARWAVFFDALGIPWEYEKEGFDLDGLRYLPDFWLPQQRCWVEIKGGTPTDEEFEKAGRLYLHTKEHVVILAGNIPSDFERARGTMYSFYAYLSTPDAWGCTEIVTFWACTACQKIFIHSPQGFNRVCECRPQSTAFDRLTAAYIAARQARFEYGESGSSVSELSCLNEDLSVDAKSFASLDPLSQANLVMKAQDILQLAQSQGYKVHATVTPPPLQSLPDWDMLTPNEIEPPSSTCALCGKPATCHTDQHTPCCEKHYQGQQRIEQELARLAAESNQTKG